MKKVKSIIFIVLLIIYSFVPLCFIIAKFIDYTLFMRDVFAPLAVTTIISITALLITLFDRERKTTLLDKIIVCILFPMSLINWILYISISKWLDIVLLTVICPVCALVIMIKYINPVPKILVSVLSVLISIPLFIGSYIGYLLSDFSSNTVVQEVYSPDKSYKAEIIDNDQGALGGNTLVNVYDLEHNIDLYFLRLSQKHQRVYSGDYGEYKKMSIYWKDDTTLVINNAEYTINK